MGRGIPIMRVQMPRPESTDYNLLSFRSQGDSGEDVNKFCTLHFDHPELDGLPIWGPVVGGTTQGWCYIMERLTKQQTGYWGGLWHANKNAFGWVGGDPITGGGGNDSFLGFCPYPQSGDQFGTSHWWEHSGCPDGYDNLWTKAGGHTTVTHNVLRTQGVRISKNDADSTKQCIAYIDLGNVINSNIIEAPDGPNGGTVFAANTIGFGESLPPAPALSIGDSTWTDYGWRERYSGYLGRIKIFKKNLSFLDYAAEAADMSRLVTADGIANIWYWKKGWPTNTSLTCDAGTGRAPSWRDSTYKASVVARSSF